MSKHSTRRSGVSKSFEKIRYEQQQGACFWCQLPLASDYQVDHVIPVAKGGTHGETNSVLSHSTCNRQKSDALPWVYAGASEWNEMLKVLDSYTDGNFAQELAVWERLPTDVKSGVLYASRDRTVAIRKAGDYNFELPLEAADYIDRLALENHLGYSFAAAVKRQLLRDVESRRHFLEINGQEVPWSLIQDILSWELSNAEDAPCLSFYLYYDGPIPRDVTEVVRSGFARIWKSLAESAV